MEPSQIDLLVDSSLAGSRSVFTSHVADPAAYVQGLKAKFIATRVYPELDRVFLEREVYGLGLQPGEREVYFVNRCEPQSVFFDPDTNSFGCAWGPELPDLRYVDLGFRSSDVLEMLSA